MDILESSKFKYLAFEELKTIIKNKFISSDMTKEQSEITADYFATAELYGVDTHGVSTIFSHIEKIKNGLYSLDPKFQVLREGTSFEVIDSDNAIGIVSAVHCAKKAINECKKKGIYTVISCNSNTYGAAFYYPLMAAKEGCIGITFCNSPATMAPYNGKEKMLGTNPIAIVVPANKNYPIIFDMASTKVAKSKIKQALDKGEKIPKGWALDENGVPTTDPLEAIKGFMLPLDEYKGYGIAMMIDILSGVLSGASYLDKVGKFYDEKKGMNLGHTFIAIDPKKVYGEGFYNLIDEYITKIRNSKSISDESKIIIPGDNKINSLIKNQKDGIKINEKIFELLKMK